MSIWDEFDKMFDIEGLAKDAEETSENDRGSFKEVPHGTYEVAINKLELTKSKKGDPMVSCWMKIVEGEYKGSLLFMNQVITRGFLIHKANEFLRALVSELDESIDVKFDSFIQYGYMIMDIAESIDNNFEYKVCYYDNKGFNAFEIQEVYPLEN